MKKAALSSFVGVLCALALFSSSAAGPLSDSAASHPVAIADPWPAAAAPPAVNEGGTTPAADNGNEAVLAPSAESETPKAAPAPQPPSASVNEPVDSVAEPVDSATEPDGAPADSVSSTPAEPVDSTPSAAEASSASGLAATPGPEVPSVPPLWAPDEELGSPASSLAVPESEHVPEPEPAQAQALVPDSNAAAILTVFNRINEYRVSRGLAKVKYHATVAGMAQEWSDNIASREVIEHRANFWQDPRALKPNNGAGEVIAIRGDRDAAMLVEWWKTSPGHNAMLLDPRFNVMGAGITYTDRVYKIWGVVNFFGYTTLPAGTTDAPGGSTGGGGGALPVPAPSMCDAPSKHMPPTLDLSSAAITSPGDLVTIDGAGQVVNRPSLGGRNYGPPRIIGSGFGTAKELFTPDWDRDGAYDLLTQWTNGDLTLHRGIAGGGFHPPVKLGAGGWNTLTLAVGTWCANNRMPQILAVDTSGNLFMYPNKGLGDLSARVTAATGLFASRLSMVDYDGDGFQDLLGLRADGSVQLYRGGGTTALRAEARPTVATGWGDVTGMRPLKHVTALNSTGLALRRANDAVQYWDLSGGSLAAPSNVSGPWFGARLAQ